MLVIFSGGSGVGKNTVISELLKSGDFALLPTYTTREKRVGETEGNPYCYLTDEEFKQKIADGELYEYQNVHGHFYGTSKLLLKKQRALGKILLKDIDVLGTQDLVKSIGKDVKIVTLFLKVDSKDVLVERLTERKETEIEKRLSRYDMEMSFCNKYDYIITNYNLDDTKNTVLKIVNAEKQNVPFSVATPYVYNESKVKEYVQKLKNGEILSPIQIAYSGDKPCIISGADKYLAGILADRTVAKEIVSDYKGVECDQTSWVKAIEELKNK